jgi:hypothetical protein
MHFPSPSAVFRKPIRRRKRLDVAYRFELPDRLKQPAFDLRDVGCRQARRVDLDGSRQTDLLARENLKVEAQRFSHVKAFVEKAKQPPGDSAFERPVKMEIQKLEVPFPEVAEHEIIPLEDRTAVRGKGAFLTRFIKLDLFQEMKTGVDPLASPFVPPGVFIIQRNP